MNKPPAPAGGLRRFRGCGLPHLSGFLTRSSTTRCFSAAISRPVPKPVGRTLNTVKQMVSLSPWLLRVVQSVGGFELLLAQRDGERQGYDARVEVERFRL